MNNYEQKLVDKYSAYLKAIQTFVDKNIVGEKCMTAAAIADGFTKGMAKDATPELISFINYFRLAVREGLITGIKGVKKAGYRRCSDNPPLKTDDNDSSSTLVSFTEPLVDTTPIPEPDPIITITATESNNSVKKYEQKKLDEIKPFLSEIQAFVDKNIFASRKMTAGDFAEKFVAQLKVDKSERPKREVFETAFRIAVRDGLITGIESGGRGSGGYRKIGTGPVAVNKPKETTKDDGEEESSTKHSAEINISEHTRLVSADHRNWTLQVLRGSAWANEAYFSNFRPMLESVTVRRIIDEELRNSGTFDINELEDKITSIEERIAGLLQKMIIELDWNSVCAKLKIPADSRPDVALDAIDSLIEAADVTRSIVDKPAGMQRVDGQLDDLLGHN
jgi:hypothetical protein